MQIGPYGVAVMNTIREAKRRVVREALSGAARELVLERGLDAVTVEDIARAAGVSTRTFFNYFATKDDAIIGIEPELITELVTAMCNRPESETPAQALHAVIFEQADLEQMPRMWEEHNELVHRHPALFPRYLASMAEVESAVAAALAERYGVDPATDPRPQALVASAMGVLRATVTWWLDTDRSEPLLDLADRTYRSLVADLADLGTG